jgi:hypothetical protein
MEMQSLKLSSMQEGISRTRYKRHGPRSQRSRSGTAQKEEGSAESRASKDLLGNGQKNASRWAAEAAQCKPEHLVP